MSCHVMPCYVVCVFGKAHFCQVRSSQATSSFAPTYETLMSIINAPRFSCADAPPRNAQIHRVYSCVLSFTCCWGLTVVQSLTEFRTCTEQIQIFEPTVFGIGTRSLRRVVCEQLTDVPQCGVLNSCCWYEQVALVDIHIGSVSHDVTNGGSSSRSQRG
jgi:hypothetical protein